MATIDVARKFAEDAIKVESVLGKSRIMGNAGRVVLLLTMAKDLGVLQKDVVGAMALPKDVVSKLVGTLVEAGLFTKKRDGENSRMMRLARTDSGTELLSQVNAVLQPPRREAPKIKPKPKHTYGQVNIFGETVAT